MAILRNGQVITLQADNGLYLSRIRRGDLDPIEAAKSTVDVFCQFTVNVLPNNQITLQADNSLYLSRIRRGSLDPIEAAKSSVDVFCQFTITVVRDVFPKANTYYNLIARHSGKALDVSGASQQNGANVIQWDKTGGDNQKWQLVDTGQILGEGYYQIIARHSGKALDVSGASQQNGANVVQWDKTGGDNQKWQLVDAGGGYYNLIVRHSGKALDVFGASQQNGANVGQWDKTGGDNQKWQLVEV
jgi:ribosomal silencing factor RsfS